MSIFVYIILLAIASYAFLKGRERIGLTKLDLSIGLGIKVLYSIVFILVFTYFYGNGKLTGDAWSFFKDGAALNELAKTHPGEYLKVFFGLGELDPSVFQSILDNTNIWTTSNNGDLINDNRLIIRINSIIHFFSFGSPYIHALVFSIIAFIGSLFIYKGLSDMVQRKKLFYYSLLLFPSIGFWGSGIGKESILVFGIGIFIYSLRKWKNRPILNTILFALAVLILSWNKPYVGLVLIATCSIFLIYKIDKIRKKGVLIFAILSVIGFVILCNAPAKINLVHKISYKQKDLINLGRGGVFFVTDSSFCAFDFVHYKNFKISLDSVQVLKSTPGEYKLFGESEFYAFEIPSGDKNYEKYLVQPPSNSYFEATRIEYSTLNLIKTIPSALNTVMIRPFPWDNGSGFKYLAFISNLALIVMLVLGFIQRRSLGIEEKHWIYFLLFSAIFTALIIGWTVPILGAVVRYKMAIDLLLIILIFILWKRPSSVSE